MSSSSSAQHMRVVVGASDAGLRLDQFLAARIPDLSRRKARLLIDLGGVFINKARIKLAGRLMKKGEVVEAHLGGALERATPQLGRAAREKDAAALPEHQVLFEDDHLVVVNKPAGLLTAPTPESDRNNLVDQLSRTIMQNGRARGPVFVVHRLDMPTSGILVLAKDDAANTALGEIFRVHDVERVYWGIVTGRPTFETLRVDKPIENRRAVTHLTVRARWGGVSWIEAKLETGRTHQIRIHCQGLGHPLLGDPLYGRGAKGPRPPRLSLHAHRLGFQHPITHAPLLFETPWPLDMAAFVAGLAPGAG